MYKAQLKRISAAIARGMKKKDYAVETSGLVCEASRKAKTGAVLRVTTIPYLHRSGDLVAEPTLAIIIPDFQKKAMALCGRDDFGEGPAALVTRQGTLVSQRTPEPRWRFSVLEKKLKPEQISEICNELDTFVSLAEQLATYDAIVSIGLHEEPVGWYCTQTEYLAYAWLLTRRFDEAVRVANSERDRIAARSNAYGEPFSEDLRQQARQFAARVASLAEELKQKS